MNRYTPAYLIFIPLYLPQNPTLALKPTKDTTPFKQLYIYFFVTHLVEVQPPHILLLVQQVATGDVRAEQVGRTDGRKEKI